MRVVYLVLLLTFGSAGRGGLVLDNGKILKQTFQSIADAQTDLLLTTVDLIFLQVNELVANLTEKMTLFENRLLEVERRLGEDDPEDDDHDQTTEAPVEEPTGHDTIIFLLKGMNHILVEKTGAIDQRLENLENQVSNFRWRASQRPDEGDDHTVPMPQESLRRSDPPKEGAPASLTPSRTQTRMTKQTSTENPLDTFTFKIYNFTPTSVVPTDVTNSSSTSATTSRSSPVTTKNTSIDTTPTTTSVETSFFNSTVQLATSEPTTQASSFTVEPTTSKSIPKTCNEVWKNELQEPGMYLIDPDGAGGVDPFRVYCDEGFTHVRHRRSYLEVRVTNHEEPGSFVFRPKYPVSVDQLKALTAKSEFCDQYIKYECRAAVLLYGSKDRGSVNYGWLVSIDGDKMVNWGGAPTNSSLCACGVDDSCISPGLPCNCDGDSRIKLIDEGVLMDKSVLPITEVRLGDTGGRREHGRLWLGTLRCFE